LPAQVACVAAMKAVARPSILSSLWFLHVR
jgi:hypothetical protein